MSNKIISTFDHAFGDRIVLSGGEGVKLPAKMYSDGRGPQSTLWWAPSSKMPCLIPDLLLSEFTGRR